jgi:hypothetical protein
MISLKWKYKRDVVIVSTHLAVEEDLKVCRRKQLFCSLLKKYKRRLGEVEKCD